MSVGFYNEIKKEQGDTSQILRFDSMNHLVDVVNDGYDNQKWDNKFHNSINNKRWTDKTDNWTWGNTYSSDIQRTKQFIRDGNIDDLHFIKIQETLKLVERSPEYNKITRLTEKFRKIKFKDEGDELSIDKLMCGDPQHWIKVEKTSERPLYRIVIMGTAGARNNEDYFLNTATVAYCIAMIKQRENKSVEIDYLLSANNVTDEVDNAYYFINLKKAHESCDMKKICIPVIAGVQRAYAFSLDTNVLIGHPNSGLGQPKTYKNELDPKYDLIINATEIDDVIGYIRNKLEVKR